MLPPLSKDQYERLVPQWAKDADAKNPRDKLAVGMRVYDVLYGPLYEGSPFGTVEEILWDGEGVCVRHDDSGHAAAAASYYVPVPVEGI